MPYLIVNDRSIPWHYLTVSRDFNSATVFAKDAEDFTLTEANEVMRGQAERYRDGWRIVPMDPTNG